MRALSIRQPWAWLIIHGGKDIENRLWSTKVRGPFLVHACKTMHVLDDYVAGVELADGVSPGLDIPDPDELLKGGIIGSVDLVEVLAPQGMTDNPGWRRAGHHGFRLARPLPLPFLPCAGALGFWGEFAIDNGKAVQLSAPARGGGRKRINATKEW